MTIRRLEGVGGGALGGRMALVKVFGSHGGVGVVFLEKASTYAATPFFCVVWCGRVLFYIWKKTSVVFV